ncbi:ras association domain-containing protein 1 isoform X1 [Pimephales promelas]|uniref:ras association domain-containing protein 1 isoform X1 n=1 Tax=Pimephales promelas TaxID=90988 RepID=UPI00195549E9|nr:ras association domain-containing protein 1 isoform X1 [Pimephales promelas]XP_039547216.1 ras association domain-containing protein 1 isoform X1 [Pimephales promelas]KAG1941123.1 ras association domain-containing protein [Pimephales promelas]KAG1941126.1 ras association domain-containing protein [Pimephales promelas]
MAKCELIELQDLTPGDRIELAPPRSKEKVVRMVGERVRLEDPDWLSCKPGRGHDLQPCSQTQLSWCDLCGEFIWGLYRQSLRCTHCNYTCHYRCQPFIQLDCSSNCDAIHEQTNYCEDTIETDTNVDEPVDCRKQELSVAEIQQKVKEYNAQVNSNLFMVLNRDGSYTGFIKVQFKLARPVSLPPSRSTSSSSGWDCTEALQHRTSFYLPRDTVKHLHISSKTRAREVIEALLKKFTVVDNPAKFSLFERSERQNQVYLKKIPDDECPLFLRLCAGPNEKVLSLVLKENETGEVNWDAFSFPELKNFLRILQREEEDHVRQIVRRYASARDKMKEAMKNFSTPG